jgi:hypothetical protein
VLLLGEKSLITAPAKRLAKISVPEMYTPLKQSFHEKGLFIAVCHNISSLKDTNFLFDRRIYKSTSFVLSKPVKWKRTYSNHKKS